MGRPPRHDADSMLDAAVRLVGEGGPAAVTVAAVARAVGGPSGSVYHRFAGRPALAAALWNRTVARFQEGWLAALAGAPPPAAEALPAADASPAAASAPDAPPAPASPTPTSPTRAASIPTLLPPAVRAAADAARHVVAWSRAHEDEARVLLYGAADFDEPNWAPDDRAELRRLNGRIMPALDDLAARLGGGAELAELLTIATIDLPGAVVRRHLRRGKGIPAGAEAMVSRAAVSLLVLETCL